MLKRLTIENFRGFGRLETPELTRFNIVGGENDVGKSSLLEAIFLLSGMERSDISTFLNSGRLIDVDRMDDLLSIFRGQDIKRTVKVVGNFEKATIREVRLQAKTAGELDFQDYGKSEADGGGDARLAPALVQTYHLKLGGQVVAQRTLPLLVDHGGNIKRTAWVAPIHPWPCLYVPARKSLTGIRYLKAMINQKRKGVLVSALHDIDPRISDLTVNGDKIMVDVGLPGSLLPLQALGDGVVRTVDVLASMDACRGGTLCIDEIDNGLHHTAMRIFWRALVEFAHEGDVQVIATTHNLELMRHIVAETAAEGTEDLTYIRLSFRGKSETSAAAFNVTDLERALAMGLDVRG